MASNTPATALTLFPLQAVLFPGGLLSLKVFEPRYVDLVTTSLREQRAFGVVALKGGREARRAEDGQHFETTGTVAELIDIDSERSGILQVRCRGLQRFVVEQSRAQADGLWQAQIRLLPNDTLLAPPPALLEAVRGLASAIASLKGRGSEPFLAPHRFDDAGWVANRWCEILPISTVAKQKLMELPDPLVRLQLVDDFLRSRGVVK
ncbi:MAG: LON peptidase substrate-binding domain-containing protein [Burkholderiaceae bacterium]